MTKTEILKDHCIREIFDKAAGLRLEIQMCRMHGGKWIKNSLNFASLSSHTILCQIPENEAVRHESLKEDQPVGISFQFEQSKYIFDTTIAHFTNQTIELEIPDHLEKMPRRAYERQPVPAALHINVLFWHRGYPDNSTDTPPENYWQGSLVNLSANGAQLSTPMSLAENFTSGQLIGLQFTPMFYQKPVLLEGQIIHIQPNQGESNIHLGIEFLGLEVSIEGRDILHRLMDIVHEYARRNNAPTI